MISGLAVAAAVAVAAPAGCTVPNGPHHSGGSETERESDTGNGPDTGNGTPFTDPEKAEMYRELTRPLPYHGGDENAPCGAWSAATEKDAREMREAHQRCLDERQHR
ncbi:hypothetical protein [Amycolatopsis sp. FU40]|uniref:hypothetical protein n=1 Tax=Amycolatopsis sp. FU40 TaxID=2914159 RepID=UPI001F257DA3|nr:hypothetical protein [Amycolatopsis sp. FU40]